MSVTKSIQNIMSILKFFALIILLPIVIGTINSFINELSRLKFNNLDEVFFAGIFCISKNVHTTIY